MTTGDVTVGDGVRLFGPFAALHELGLPGSETTDVYSGFYAGFYDAVTAADEHDLPAYHEAAERHGGPVLELAAGSGRIALPLARAGVDVVAIDLSADMLAALAQRVAAEDPQVRDRVRTAVADMTALDLPERFALVVLGEMTVCLLLDRATRAATFASVARHLAPGGRFLVDFLATSPDALRAQERDMLTVSAAGENAKQFTLIGRRWYEDEGVQVVNFYTEIVAADGRARRFIAGTTKAVVAEAELREDLRRAGLEVVGARVTARLGDAHPEEIRLLECARSGEG
jgi:methylation protein MtfA